MLAVQHFLHNLLVPLVGLLFLRVVCVNVCEASFDNDVADRRDHASLVCHLLRVNGIELEEFLC